MSKWKDKLNPINYKIGEEVEVFPPAGHSLKANIEKFGWNEKEEIYYCYTVAECDKSRDESGFYRSAYPFVSRYFSKNKRTVESEKDLAY